jgi:hypothetical protein
LFARAPEVVEIKVANPIPKAAAVIKPNPVEQKHVMATTAPANLPAVEYLEIEAPKKAAPPPEPAQYVPDWAHLPGLRIMPQNPSELPQESRAPLIKAA